MLNASALVTAEKIFKRYFNDCIGAMAAGNLLSDLATLFMIVPSDGSEEDYRWLGSMPQFAEWLGDLNVDDLANYAYTLRNKHFAAAVGIHEDEIKDDKFGIILPRIAAQAQRYPQHKGKLADNLLVNATTNLAHDGIAFFSAATGVRLNGNLTTGTISAATPTLAQVAADVITVRKQMMAFVDDKGEIIGLVPDTYVIPPNLETIFLQLLGASADPTLTNPGTINPYRRYIKNLFVDPLLSDANDFYALCTSYALKPLVYQDRQMVEQQLIAQPTNMKLIFAADYRGVAGYTLPVLAVKSVSAVG